VINIDHIARKQACNFYRNFLGGEMSGGKISHRQSSGTTSWRLIYTMVATLSEATILAREMVGSVEHSSCESKRQFIWHGGYHAAVAVCA
jgi:hypothetical protein